MGPGNLAPVAALVLAGLVASGCKGDTSKGGGAAAAVDGSGSTFVNPLLSKWVSAYQAQSVTRINYQPVGSGAGVKAITDKTVDFGATDAPMSDAQLAAAGGKILHVPLTLGAVVLTYNLAGGPPHLQLTPDLVAGLFLGDIKRWDDPRLLEANPGAKLPAQPVAVVYRADGSGTTAVFTDYLAKVSSTWKDKVGSGTSVHWPAGTGANKNDGVMAQVQQTAGAIGYVELAFARQTKQPVANLRNKAGKFVEPTLASTTAAAEGTARLPEDLRMSLTDPDGDAAYPIAALSYALVYEDTPNRERGRAVAEFLWWGIHDGQKLGAGLDYAPLPPAVVAQAETKLRSLKSAGTPLLGSGK